MVDTRTPDQRRRIMQAVKTRDTGPEQEVRRLLHGMGYRFRVHRSDLPGSPDIVLPKYKTLIFVHGCFWHGHKCPKGRLPKSRPEYWGPKIEANRARDRKSRKKLVALGWSVHNVWQCELTEPARLKIRLDKFLKMQL